MKAVMATAIVVDGSDDFESVLSVSFLDFSFENFFLSARGGAISVSLSQKLIQEICISFSVFVCIQNTYINNGTNHMPMKKQL